MIDKIIILFFLYIFGIILYQKFKVFQIYLIPSSLISGVMILFIKKDFLSQEFLNMINDLPKELISFFFAGFLLENRFKILSDQSLLISIFRQGIFVWLIALYQLIVGFTLAFFLFDSNQEMLIASIIEVGWIGGYGSASAFYSITKELGFPQAGELGILSATSGSLIGTFTGLILINFLRKKNQKKILKLEQSKTEFLEEQFDFSNTITGIFIPFIPLLISLILKRFFLDNILYFKSIPSFFIVIIVTTLIKPLLFLFFDYTKINSGIRIFTKVSLDILIICAIGSINLGVLETYSRIFIIYTIVASILNIILFFLSPLFIPYYPDLSLINYGMSTGTTATGMLILESYSNHKIPIKPTVIYASAAPLSAPFIGGGLVSLSVPYLIVNGYFYETYMVLLIICIIFIILNRILYRFEFK